MELNYIGASGRLNSILVKRLQTVDFPLRVSCYSAMDINYDSFNPTALTIFGGRRFINAHQEYAQLNKINIIYLNTLIPNDFFDLYQFLKSKDEVIISKLGGQSLNIPFISEFLPPKLSSLITDEPSDYVICVTSINDIVESIVGYSKDSSLNLKISNKFIHYNWVDGKLWSVFARLYGFEHYFGGKLKEKYLLFIKILEKITNLVFIGSGISAVFVKKQGD